MPAGWCSFAPAENQPSPSGAASGPQWLEDRADLVGRHGRLRRVDDEEDLAARNRRFELRGRVDVHADTDERAGDRTARMRAARHVLPQIAGPHDGAVAWHDHGLDSPEPVPEVSH